MIVVDRRHVDRSIHHDHGRGGEGGGGAVEVLAEAEVCGRRATTVRGQAARQGAGGGARTSGSPTSPASPASADIVVAAMFAGEPRCHNDVAELASRRTSLWQRCSRWPARRRRATAERVADRRADRGPIGSLGDGAGVGAQVQPGASGSARGTCALTGAVMAREPGKPARCQPPGEFLLAAGAEADAAGHGLTILACAGWPVPVPHRVRGDRGRGCWQGCRGPGSVFSMARRAAWLSGVSFRIWRNPL